MWEDFDPTSALLDSSTVCESEDSNIVCSKQTFFVDGDESGAIRAYIEIYADSRWTDARAAVLLLPPLVDVSMAALTKRLVADGYAVGVLSYAGVRGETVLPQSCAYAAYPECLSRLDTIEESARKTPWYVWNKMARRAITLLSSLPLVDAERIGLIGIGEGAHLAWQVAGVDKRVRALVPICGGGYRWAKNYPRFTHGNVPTNDEETAYSTGVGAETYAKSVACPTFYLTSRMSQYCDVDRAGDILSIVKSDIKKLLIMNSVDLQITKSAADVTLNWLRASFSTAARPVENPTMSFEVAEGKLYLHINTAHKAKNAEIYISCGEPIPYARHWTRLQNMQKIGSHEYIVFVPLHDPTELIVAYATFTYEDGDGCSTPVIGAIPAKMGATATAEGAKLSRIIYDNSMGTDMFCVKTDSIILEDGLLLTKTGPFDISGVTTAAGNLLLCRSEREIESLAGTSTLHFDAYSNCARELEINVYTVDQKKYTAHAWLKGGEFWQKIQLSSADFKSEEGRTLAKFANGKVLAIANAEGLLFNNFLWI